MAKFDFRLQALLNVKRQLEKSVKNELGAAIRELENQKAILNEMQLVIASQENEYRKDGVRKIRLSKLKQRLEYIRSMYEKEDLQQQRVNEEIRNVDKIRVRLIEIMKEKKLLEKLKEKELIEFKKQQDKIERVHIDELASYAKYTNEAFVHIVFVFVKVQRLNFFLRIKNVIPFVVNLVFLPSKQVQSLRGNNVSEFIDREISRAGEHRRAFSTCAYNEKAFPLYR
jgi:flagellar FliJ protein